MLDLLADADFTNQEEKLLVWSQQIESGEAKNDLQFDQFLSGKLKTTKSNSVPFMNILRGEAYC